ncbi:MAG: hypothetical protein ACKOAG_01605 [Candidatus Kapaibacterium sp.]
MSMIVLTGHAGMSAHHIRSVPPLATVVRSNFAVMDDLCASAAQRFTAAFPGGGHVSATSLSVLPHPAAWLVRQHVVAAQERMHRGNELICEMSVVECGVVYGSLPEKDSLQRRCRVELRGIAGASVIGPIEAVLVDTIARADVPLVETPRHEAFTAMVPAPQTTLWDEILEPLLVVGALATTVVLLFTVRSQ